jgi:hypothetical protein
LCLAAAFLVANFSGCQIVIGVLQILNGFPKTTCEFTAWTKKRLSEKGKRVIVVCSSPSAAQTEEPALDLDVIAVVSRRLKADNVTVVDPHKVTTWIDDNGGITESTDLAPIGVEFAADYIILFRFTDFGYLEPNSPGMFRGHASVTAVVDEAKRLQRLDRGAPLIGVATADLFPRVTFIGSIGLQANTFTGLGKAGADTWTFGPRITWAALDLGRVQARITAAEITGYTGADFNDLFPWWMLIIHSIKSGYTFNIVNSQSNRLGHCL